MGVDKFFQPIDGIELAEKGPEPRSWLLPEDLPLDATDEQIEEATIQEIEREGELRLRTAASGESEIHTIADKQEAALFVAIHAAFKVAQSKLRATHDVKKTVASLKKALEMTVPMLVIRAMRAGGEFASNELKTAEEFRAAKRSEKKFKLGFSFNKEDRYAVDWADRHAAELIDGISETSREAINNAIADLLESGDWEDAIDEILAAVGDPERARRIARNEVMTAVSEGQRQAWKQALKAGALDDDMRRTWITVGDDKVCPICEPLEGAVADIDGTYPGDGYGPPAHPMCRCTEGLI